MGRGGSRRLPHGRGTGAVEKSRGLCRRCHWYLGSLSRPGTLVERRLLLLSGRQRGGRNLCHGPADALVERLGGGVIGGLKQMGSKQGLRGAKKKQLAAAVTYLENNRDSMRYDYYLDCGYPIGSGVVEGACRHLVKDRMEGTGMRWRTEGTQFMLDLRAVYLNGKWNDFQEYRVQQNGHTLYPYRERMQEIWDIAA